MPPLLQTLFILILFYSPFLFIVFIPSHTFLHSKQKRFDACQTLEPLIPSLWPMVERSLCQKEQTLAVIKPDGFNQASDIMAILKASHFDLVTSKTMTLTESTVADWYHTKRNESYYPSLQRYLTRGPVQVLVLERVGAIDGLRQVIGPTDPQLARQRLPRSIRALFGTNIQENAIHASDSLATYVTEKALLLD
ncbi:nucleoside diphosphate kinase [Chlamydoabsidia padenii]|nr:nucleoside diphosphate kinase [Chlamydoabsidia padenii]